MKARSAASTSALYEKTKIVVEKTESAIINFQLSLNWFHSACRFLIFPLKYMLTGLSELTRPASIGSFFAFGLMSLIPFFMEHLGIAREHYLVVFYVIIGFPAALIIFAVPTTFMTNGVKKINVMQVVSELKIAGFVDSDDLDLFEKNVEKFSVRVDSRVTFYRWVVGVSWALYLISFNLQVRLASEQQSTTFFQQLGEQMLSLVIMAVAVSASVVLIIAYKRASELLFTTLEVGCTEYRFQLLQKKREETTA